MKTPPKTSPWNYFQERYRNNPWKLLVCVMMLNQTSGKQVEHVHGPFFATYPDPKTASEADPEQMASILRPLGFQNRRAKTIIRMSQKYVAGGWTDPRDLPGVGKYAHDSWRIFIDGELVDGVEDKELRKYLEWARSQQ